MKRLTIPLPGRQYDILMGPDLLERAGVLLSERMPPSPAALVSDETVFGLYGQKVLDALKQAGFAPFVHTVPPGENSKSLANLETLCNTFARKGLLRNQPVIALGGGIVGDLAGLAAAVYMRGVPFIQLPTTLLAQVDASVGGKVAVNLPLGKNLVGAFHQPRLVLADTGVLGTLSDRDFASGMAEVIKTALLSGEKLMRSVEKCKNRAGIVPELPEMLHACCRFKGEIVLTDEKESGLRRILNLGHTFGHAVEKLGGFARYTHGEAVAIGMVWAARIGEGLKITERGLPERLIALCRSYGLPVETEYPLEKLIPEMKTDKKNQGERITLILPEGVGMPIVYPIDVSVLKEAGHG